MSESFGKIIDALTFQIDFLMFFEGKRRRDFLADTYFIRYAFGMFDAVTMIFPLHLRQQLGRGVIEMGFVPFMKKEFGLDDVIVRKIMENLFLIYHENLGDDIAMRDGGWDGALRLQGGNADRLVEHFHCSEGETISPAQFDEFRRYHGRLTTMRADPLRTTMI
jgi:hypothetical protein